ncbi:winged helix-turn-helix transcriptional regulator [Streptomyces sp. Tu 2975]|uniref:ArsR/SmtB family transcription factor n=1 Tax=Streptomyces sp. Tu 2975 TaxID=2676871 RepID=UPI001356F1CB|nr:winged helix-turn-helix domain-containing protein [Streptomyces sp. Tu 2975]QIP86817.1 winged helix-turn-helix transcriptional regulator [Streptomyces sp. Tu 2975]
MSENPAPDQGPELTGDALLKVLTALGNPHRMRIVAALSDGRDYVSRLARELAIGRPLLHMHLQRLEAAGLVRGELELSEGGKAMKFFELTPFCYALTPEVVARAARTLTDEVKDDKGKDTEKNTMKETAK